MSLLDYIFPLKKKDDKKKKGYFLFTNSGQVDHALFRIDTLDEKEGKLVKEIIMKHLSYGNGHGLTCQNFKDNVLPELYKLVKDHELSTVDYERLKKLPNEYSPTLN